MGISRYIFVTVLACCALGSLQATNEAPRHQKKHYLDEQAISVTKDGIVVSAKKGSFRLKALRSDEKGFYVYQQDVCKETTKGFDDPDYWAQCPDCGKIFEVGHHERRFVLVKDLFPHSLKDPGLMKMDEFTLGKFFFQEFERATISSNNNVVPVFHELPDYRNRSGGMADSPIERADKNSG